MPHGYRSWAVADAQCGASISNKISDQREVHAMVSPMWLDALRVSMRNANTCAGVPGGATVKLSATRLKPPTQEPNLRSFVPPSFRFRRPELRQACVSAAALAAFFAYLLSSKLVKSWQHPEVFPGGPPPQY